MKTNKKIIALAIFCAALSAAAFAESSWNKILFAGVSAPIAHQKTDGDAMNYAGVGGNVDFLAVNKDNGLSFLGNFTGAAIFSDDLTKENETGGLVNLFGGVGYAPLRTETLTLALTGGIGFDYYRYQLSANSVDSAVSGLNLLAGIDVGLAVQLSKRVGIGFNVLGTVALVGCHSVDRDLDDGVRNDDYEDTENKLVKAGSLAVTPSVCVTIHF
ncbi:MAG: hypothetical protein NC041_03385 [Bacteroides sp.]|nr:hypothetical protein [Prevotella sp.]MCM1408167.1 hypothetical protein [Treponema brennaborense]MCM1469491.1 hypothetical protein [Bacteroides sp.]